MDYTDLLSQRAKLLKPSPIRELFKYSSNKEIISFGGGYPDPSTFPVSEVAFKTIYDQDITINQDEILSLLQYGASCGDPNLLSIISDWQYYKNNTRFPKESFLVLNGSQEGIFAIGFLFIDDNDSIIVSEPVYPGTISAFNAFSPRYLSVPLSPDGMDLDYMERELKRIKTLREKIPKFIYIIPNGHNPGGVTMSLECRKRLLQISYSYNILIIEDDPYELVSFRKDKLPTLQSLDDRGMVIRLDSFSKILIPGFRIGYASANYQVIKLIELFKQSSNLHTSSFTQGLLCKYLKTIGFDEFMDHINRISSYYSEKMEYMSMLLDEQLGDRITYNKPDSGLFIWITFNDPGIDTKSLLFDNIDRLKVIAVPGSSFSVKNQLHNSLRLSFGTLDNHKIKEGILRLRSFFKEAY